ncbi:uncharacterized protein LOC117505047 [Thalassophryne amazonica]|uniref:uncharacterized protein LOC117505047 n=1 Tax=Thalassophryne amazonica TaxID=390379 RepID=UPI001471F454|nr:uncharacterized protein LOC117505047 [Thalassophryne amazonica]
MLFSSLKFIDTQQVMGEDVKTVIRVAAVGDMQPEWNPSLDQKYSEPLDIKEEQEELWESTSDSEVSEMFKANSQAKKKRKKVAATLSREEEELMVEWLRDHPEMYDKRLSQYKNIQRKDALWDEKAREMKKDTAKLKVWYKSLRTRMGKLMKKKTTKGDEELTDRDKWILANLEFLRVHIARVHRKPFVSIAQVPPPAAATVSAAAVGINESNTPDMNDPTAPTPSSTNSSSTTTPHVQPANLSHGRRGDEQDMRLLASLQDQVTQLMAMQQQLLQRMRPEGNRERLGFVEWVRSTLVSLEHDCWRRCQKDMIRMLMSYIDENDTIRRSACASAPSDAPAPPASSANSCYPGPSHAPDGQPPAQQMWQPQPHQWPAQIQNPTSVFGSMEASWMQQFPQMNFGSGSTSQSQPRSWSAPPTTSTSTLES